MLENNINHGFETCTNPHYFILNFYQISRNDEIRTCDRLVIKVPLGDQGSDTMSKNHLNPIA